MIVSIRKMVLVILITRRRTSQACSICIYMQQEYGRKHAIEFLTIMKSRWSQVTQRIRSRECVKCLFLQNLFASIQCGQFCIEKPVNPVFIFVSSLFTMNHYIYLCLFSSFIFLLHIFYLHLGYPHIESVGYFFIFLFAIENQKRFCVNLENDVLTVRVSPFRRDL